jgi:hypothetical protein
MPGPIDVGFQSRRRRPRGCWLRPHLDPFSLTALQSKARSAPNCSGKTRPFILPVRKRLTPRRPPPLSARSPRPGKASAFPADQRPSKHWILAEACRPLPVVTCVSHSWATALRPLGLGDSSRPRETFVRAPWIASSPNFRSTPLVFRIMHATTNKYPREICNKEGKTTDAPAPVIRTTLPVSRGF